MSVEAKPRFVKVNRQEAEDLIGKAVRTTPEAVSAAQEIIRRGAASAAITLGSEGLIWVESQQRTSMESKTAAAEGYLGRWFR